MMKYRKIVPYKLMRLIPMAMIAGMPLISTSCDKEPPHHDTTYMWGSQNYDAIVFGPKITASADSTLVDHVIMMNDGNSWQGAPPMIVLMCIEKIMDEVQSDNKDKIRWTGTLEGLALDKQGPQTYRDSATLAQMGFKFGKVYHYDRRLYERNGVHAYCSSKGSINN